MLLLSRRNNNTSRIFHTKMLKNGVLQWNIELVLLLSRLNNNTSTILHFKTPFFKRFTMEYMPSAMTFTSAQGVYSIVQQLKNCVLN